MGETLVYVNRHHLAMGCVKIRERDKAGDFVFEEKQYNFALFKTEPLRLCEREKRKLC